MSIEQQSTSPQVETSTSLPVLQENVESSELDQIQEKSNTSTDSQSNQSNITSTTITSSTLPSSSSSSSISSTITKEPTVEKTTSEIPNPLLSSSATNTYLSSKVFRSYINYCSNWVKNTSALSDQLDSYSKEYKSNEILTSSSAASIDSTTSNSSLALKRNFSATDINFSTTPSLLTSTPYHLNATTDGFPRSSDDSSFIINTSSGKRSRITFPWLVCLGDSYISENKKKKKKIFCLYCASYNSSTPWAHIKLRKVDLDILQEHEKSSQHMKAVSMRAERKNEESKLTSNLYNKTTIINANNIKEFYDNLADEDYSVTVAIPASSSSSSSFSSGYTSTSIHNLSTPFSETHVDSAYHREKVRETIQESVNNSKLDDEELKRLMKKRKYPVWLEYDPTLRFSSLQEKLGIVDDGTNNKKKKYRNMKCVLCAKYMPDTNWGTMKPRKYEYQIFVDHEKSSNHRKALALSESDRL